MREGRPATRSVHFSHVVPEYMIEFVRHVRETCLCKHTHMREGRPATRSGHFSHVVPESIRPAGRWRCTLPNTFLEYR